MKTPIKPSDIRAGDLVRVEHEATSLRATEYVAESDGQDYRAIPADRIYLLDRPTPPVELPTEPTLGWATFRVDSGASEVCLSMWSGPRMRPACQHGGAAGGDPEYVTAFTRATAVPAEAMEKLRRAVDRQALTDAAVDAFLAAVDGANR